MNMIQLVVSDHRFEPMLIARCTLCDWKARHGKVIALATVIARAQDHVQQEHHTESRPADEVGLPGVTDRVGVDLDMGVADGCWVTGCELPMFDGVVVEDGVGFHRHSILASL